MLNKLNSHTSKNIVFLKTCHKVTPKCNISKFTEGVFKIPNTVCYLGFVVLYVPNCTHIGPSHTRYYCTQYCDKMILQLKDIKTFFIQCFFLCKLKIFIFGQLCLLKPSLKRF